jgi:hypothetical protein
LFSGDEGGIGFIIVRFEFTHTLEVSCWVSWLNW